MRMVNYNNNKEEQEYKIGDILSDEMVLKLCEYGMKNIDTMEEVTNSFEACLKDFFYAKAIFDQDIVQIFFKALHNLLKEILPNLLIGNIEAFNEHFDKEIPEEEFDTLRNLLYTNLYERYSK